MFDHLEDTIVAVSSPPGAGARGIIRLSGPRAFELAATLFAAADGPALMDSPGHRRVDGSIRIDGGLSVACEAYTFRAPASYTRQDTIELHTVGSPVLLGMVMRSLLAAGARAAEPGEFTARAFLSGRLDLTQVEAVAAVIQARDDAQLQAANRSMSGACGQVLRGVREDLAELLALIEAEIDFSEEQIRFVEPDRCRAVISGAIRQLGRFAGAPAARDLLARVVLAGPPNAGKSTLFNRLSGVERAIAAAVAGTTRDVLSAPAQLGGVEVLLCDTAGLGLAGDALAGQAEAAALRASSDADLLLVVVDPAAYTPGGLDGLLKARASRPALLVWGKRDLRGAVHDSVPGVKNVVSVSARTGAGLEELHGAAGAMLRGICEHGAGHESILVSARSTERIHAASAALGRAAELLKRPANTGELVALEVRSCLDDLAVLLGEVTTEELLGRVFARFCIGK